MRSQSRFTDARTLLETKVDNQAVQDGKTGKSGARVVADYRGIPTVLSVYAPVDFGGQPYVLLAEIDEAEVLNEAKSWIVICRRGAVMLGRRAARASSLSTDPSGASPTGARSRALRIPNSDRCTVIKAPIQPGSGRHRSSSVDSPRERQRLGDALKPRLVHVRFGSLADVCTDIA